MRVAILGAGPAGLYLAILLKRRRPDFQIDIYEQNPEGASFGFGLAFSARALQFLEAGDPETFAAIAPALETWDHSTVVLNGEAVVIDGIAYAGIGRLRLLEILLDEARALGLSPRFETRVESLAELDGADLIVGADGANSLVRRGRETQFGTTIAEFSNRFAWYGTAKRFETLGHAFLDTEFGPFNAHYHRHAPDKSTFVVETNDATFRGAGLDRMPPEEAQAFCAGIFRQTLGGTQLIANNSIWRRFPKIWNDHWWDGKCVLVGDAAHTAHFSIGSGTRLALEDAMALSEALCGNPGSLDAALAAYESMRKPAAAKLAAAANASAEWYEHFAEHMRLAPLEFAFSYITRSGRMDAERLRALSPDFARAYDARG